MDPPVSLICHHPLHYTTFFLFLLKYVVPTHCYAAAIIENMVSLCTLKIEKISLVLKFSPHSLWSCCISIKGRTGQQVACFSWEDLEEVKAIMDNVVFSFNCNININDKLREIASFEITIYSKGAYT